MSTTQFPKTLNRRNSHILSLLIVVVVIAIVVVTTVEFCRGSLMESVASECCIDREVF